MLSTSIRTRPVTIEKFDGMDDDEVANGFEKKQYSSQIISSRDLLAASRMRMNRMELATAVIEVGSQSFQGISTVGDPDSSYYGNKVIHGQPPTSQMLFLKQKHLQPLPQKTARKGHSTSLSRILSVPTKDQHMHSKTQRSTARGRRPTSQLMT